MKPAMLGEKNFRSMSPTSIIEDSADQSNMTVVP